MNALNIMSRFNVGGTSQWLYQLSRGLDERKIANVLLVGDCPKGEQEDDRLSEINHIRIPGLGPGTSPIETLRAFFAIRKAIKEINPDIVNTHTSKAGVIGRIAAKSVKSRVKVVHTYHGHVLKGYFNPFISFTIGLVEFILKFITDKFFVAGENVQLHLERLKIVPKNSILVFPGVPQMERRNLDSIRKVLEIPEDAIVFAWLGRKVKIKRLDRILNLASLRPQYFFIIAGDGERLEKTYPDYFRDKSIVNVKEIGITSPANVWMSADVCLMTSDNEAIPIAAIEASLCHIPVVSTDVGATNEIVIHNTTGFLVREFPSQMLQFMDQLANSKALREKMGAAAHKLAVSKFSPKNSLDIQVDAYRALLEN